MSDYERYGDYNSSPDDGDPYPKPLWRIVALKVIRLCFGIFLGFVALLIAARLIFFSYYPPFAKQIYMTDEISALFEGGNTPEVLTQELRVPYEDRKDGFFYADNLIVIRQSGSLQCSLRINRSAFDDIGRKHGVDMSHKTPEKLSFTLYYSDGEATEAVLAPVVAEHDSNFMYTYFKLCFEGVDLGDDVPWYRLNIHIDGVSDTESEPVGAIPVYENHEEFNTFEKYKLKDKEIGR